MRIDKLCPEKHQRRTRIQELPEPDRTRIIQERHRLLTKWQREGRPITQKPKPAYGLASAIAVCLVMHPRTSEWGSSLFHKRGGNARIREMTSQDLKIFTRNGGLVSRTMRRLKHRKLQQHIEDLKPIGEDGLIPKAWYKH